MTEDDLIEKLRAIVAPAAPGALLVGIGDDAAVWQPSRSHRSVITTDALVEGVHFTRTAMSAADVGHRALASNLSEHCRDGRETGAGNDRVRHRNCR